MRYEASLDGLRAVAISSVVLFHMSGNVMPGGWAGVDVFFVLSGFLITTILRTEAEETGNIRFGRFYLRRVLRLTPAFVCLLLFELARIAVQYDGERRLYVLEAVLVSALYLMNWSRAFDLFPQGLLGHTWSLAMEEQFYLLWPAVLMVLGRRRPISLLVGAIVLVTLWRFQLAFQGADPERTYNGFDTHSDALLIGCLLAVSPIPPRFTAWATRFSLVPSIVMAAIFLALPLRLVFTQTVGLTISALCSAWLVIAAREAGWLKTFLSRPSIVRTGRISYGWYLWHFPFLMLGKAYIPQMGGLKYVLVIALVPATYLLALASYRWVETPFLNLKRKFDDRRARPDTAAASGPGADISNDQAEGVGP